MGGDFAVVDTDQEVPVMASVLGLIPQHTYLVVWYQRGQVK